MADNQQQGSFPGYEFLTGYVTAYFDGLRALADAYNDAWNGSTGRDAQYTFGTWARDMGRIWSRTYGMVERAARYPIAYEEAGRPVWVSITSDTRANSVASNWVNLTKRVESGHEDPKATVLESLGGGGATIGGAVVELDGQRDSIRVTITLKATKDDVPPRAGTYVGFVKIPGVTGPPVAIIFLSLTDASATSK